MSDAVRVLLRFDTEDILTPESDDAALALAELLSRQGVRATFPITAMKVDALLARGRQDVLRALGRHQIGFHSTSHSYHPTIAEQLATLAGQAAVDAFRAREQAGFMRVAEVFGEAPTVYTQPGGNWTAEAIPALLGWGVRCFYSEAWNGYIDIDGRPMVLAGVLHWAAPVSVPKPWLSQIPQLHDQTLRMIGRAIAEQSAGGRLGLVNAVTHPTELVTTRFWDADPFGGGVNAAEDTWQPPPLRPHQMVSQALYSFADWLTTVRAAGPDVAFWTAEDLVAAFSDQAPRLQVTAGAQLTLLKLVAAGQLGSVAIGTVTLTPAEVLAVCLQSVAAIEHGQFPRPLTVPVQAPPWDEDATDVGRQAGQMAAPVLAEALRALSRSSQDGQVPARVWADKAAWSPLAVAAAGARMGLELLGSGQRPERVPLPEVKLLTRRFVKPAQALHWDWPIFAPGFSAPALRQRAEAVCWCLKPAEAEFADHCLDAH